MHDAWIQSCRIQLHIYFAEKVDKGRGSTQTQVRFNLIMLSQIGAQSNAIKCK